MDEEERRLLKGREEEFDGKEMVGRGARASWSSVGKSQAGRLASASVPVSMSSFRRAATACSSVSSSSPSSVSEAPSSSIGWN